MGRPDFLSPIFLAKQLGTFASEGSEITPPNIDILNPNRTAMMIDQFRFSFGTVSDGSDLGSGFPPSYICADIRLGSIPLTNGLVPIVALCPRYLGGGQLGLIDRVRANNTNGEETMLTWHLPKPLYVPTDVQITARFVRRTPYPVSGDPNGTSPPMGFGIAGRSMPEGMQKPKTIWVPWATYTQCRVSSASSKFGGGGTSQIYVSQDSDLGNMHDSPLNVTQFTGWNARYAIGGVRSGMVRSPFFVQMTLSNNKMLIRDQTPFGLLFPSDRGYFNLNAKLMAKQFVRAELEIDPPSGADAAETLEGTTIGMIGYRELPMPWSAQP